MIGPFNAITQARHGTMLYNTNDAYVGRSFELYGEFSEGEVELFKQIVCAGMVVLDVGANIGAHTLVFARIVGLNGVVYAFEPQRLAYQALAGNMALNSIVNVQCYQKALGSRRGTVIVPLLDPTVANNFGGLELGHWQQGEVVEIMPLDDLALRRCDFIKIDVEGMETEVLTGARETLRRHSPILYIENDRAAEEQPLIRHIAELGYDMYWHTPSLFNPNNFKGNPTNVFGNVASLNMLCVPKGMPRNLEGFKRIKVPS